MYNFGLSERNRVKVPEIKNVGFSNRVNPDEMAHHKPPHLYLHCLPSKSLNSQYDIAWVKLFFFFF